MLENECQVDRGGEMKRGSVGMRERLCRRKRKEKERALIAESWGEQGGLVRRERKIKRGRQLEGGRMIGSGREETGERDMERNGKMNGRGS